MSNIWIAISTFTAIGLVFGLLLGYSSCLFAVKENPIIEKIDELLPQSQCGQCGYPGCFPYAEAVGAGREKINLCVPGGKPTMLQIASLLNVDPQPIDSSNKEIKEPVHMLAVIDEPNCIGCTKCIQACPVDAIIGAFRTMHTVMASLCTGCNLCVPSCPTQCIELRRISTTLDSWKTDLDTILVRIIPMEHTCLTYFLPPEKKRSGILTVASIHQR